MNLDTLRNVYKAQIVEISNICNVEKIRVFGSTARYEDRENSDIDFLVHMKKDSGFSIGGLKWRLEELLGCKVDVIPDTSIHPTIRDQILKDAVDL